MISDLVCMDVSSMLKVTNIAKDPKMAKKQETFVRGCEANGNRVVSESIYTKDSIFTSNLPIRLSATHSCLALNVSRKLLKLKEVIEVFQHWFQVYI